MLISTTEELMEYVEVSVDLNIKKVIPSIKKAERRFIKPHLGAFYNDVQSYYNNQAEISDLKKELINLVNSATAPLAMWYYSQVGGVSMDSSGIYKPKNDQRWNLGESEQQRLENAFLSSGLDALDDLLNFLNDNLTSFPSYASSEARAENNNSLVPTAKVVQKVFTLLHPQVTYRALRESIIYVEERVANAMQNAHAYFIATSESALSPENKKILSSARKAIIYMAAARALIIRTVKFTNEGLEVLVMQGTPVSPQENSRIEAASSEYKGSGELELQNLMDLMNANPPTGYTAPVIQEITDRCITPMGSKIVFF